MSCQYLPRPHPKRHGLRKYWAFLLVAQALTSHSQPTMSLLPWLQEAVLGPVPADVCVSMGHLTPLGSASLPAGYLRVFQALQL